MNSLKFILLSTVLLVSAAGQLSAAPTYGFTGISGNSAYATAVGEAQFSVDLTSLNGGSKIRFDFYNVGPEACSIANIYWGAESGLLTKNSIINGSGVKYSWDATPSDMQGGATWIASVSADADNQKPKNGVNPGETVGFIFNIGTGKTFNDIVAGIEANTLRIGLHAISFKDGSSEWFETGNPPVVPAPAALLLATLGTSLVGLLRRRSAI